MIRVGVYAMLSITVGALLLESCAPSGAKPYGSSTTQRVFKPARSATTQQVSIAVEPKWFAGISNPPKVRPSLPPTFNVASANTWHGWTKSEGVIWAPAKTVARYATSKDRNFDTLDEPLFWIHFSPNVSQIPGTDQFTIEDGVDEMCSAMGVSDLRKRKTYWGAYPVLAVSGKRLGGTAFFAAWVGTNSTKGAVLLIDYRVPHGPTHPTTAELGIWNDLIEKSAGR